MRARACIPQPQRVLIDTHQGENKRSACAGADSRRGGRRLTDDIANRVYPMPLDTSDQDLVYVGRIRDDLTDERGLNLWCCGDQLRKGAATNAVQIAEIVAGL